MVFGYKTIVQPRHERGHVIEQQLATPVREVTSYDVFDSTQTTLRVVRVSLHLPIYRMANGRTATQQLAYIRESEVPDNYFKNGEENEVVQQTQHEILTVFSKEGKEQITPIIEVLERDQQREPILITPSGVVVNGNRRLAAMRELFTARPTDFPEFATVECAVLPALTPDQIVDIEVRLQMTPETKLPYSWVDECLMIQRQLEAGKSEEQIARVMRRSRKSIKDAMGALNEANIYLSDWRKAPGDYRHVGDSEQFFKDLPNRLKGKTGGLLEASRRVGWLLVDHRGELGTRLYAFNTTVGDKAEEVLDKLAERLEIGDDDESDDAESLGEEEGLEIDLGEEAESTSIYAALVAAIDEPARRDEITEELVRICQTTIDAGKTAKQGMSALAASRDANTRLAEIDLTKADPSTYAGIDRQLEEAVLRAESLRTKLRSYQDGMAANSASEPSA
jgi:hypothetical protein